MSDKLTQWAKAHDACEKEREYRRSYEAAVRVVVAAIDEVGRDWDADAQYRKAAAASYLTKWIEGKFLSAPAEPPDSHILESGIDPPVEQYAIGSDRGKEGGDYSAVATVNTRTGEATVVTFPPAAEMREWMHELKTWPEYFEALIDGSKTFEYRKDDRGFKVGDVLWLREYDPETQQYTRRDCYYLVDYIARGGLIPDGYVVMSVSPAEPAAEVCEWEEWRHAYGGTQYRTSCGHIPVVGGSADETPCTCRMCKLPVRIKTLAGNTNG